VTPPTTDGALEGITRRTILEVATDLGFDTRESSLGRFDLYAADAVFLTGTRAGIVPVGSLDGSPISQAGRPQLQKLRDEFESRLTSLSAGV
jgi:branched-chain amino acid aminotransferase